MSILELDLATLYVADWSRNAGLKPVMQDGSLLLVSPGPGLQMSLCTPGTRITVYPEERRERIYYLGSELSEANFSVNGSYTGEVVIAGLGISDPDEWLG